MLIEAFRDKEQFLLVKSPVFSTWKITSACDAQVCIYIYIYILISEGYALKRQNATKYTGSIQGG